MTPGPGLQPVLANVLSVRLHGWGAFDAAEQARRREQLAAALRSVLGSWAPDRRVVVDAPDGFAIAGEVDETVALDTAVRLLQHDSVAGLELGLHRGPVRIAEGNDASTPHLVGDGLDTAAAVAGCGTARPIAASQAFRDALAARAPRRASELRPAGELVEDGLRSQALFAFDPAEANRRRLRRGLLAIAGIVGVLGAGMGGRVAREEYEAAHRPAVIHLDIRPGGEVFVDGERKGAAPQLASLWVPPGPHAIEIRNGRFKPLRMDVHLQPGEAIRVRHAFVAPPPRPVARKPQQPPDAMDRLKAWWARQQQ